MSVEQVEYIHNLEPTRPQGGDSIAQGDDHLRNIKKALKQTFPNIEGEVLPTHEELNSLIGIDEKLADLEEQVQNQIESAFDENGNIIANGITLPDPGDGSITPWGVTLIGVDPSDPDAQATLLPTNPDGTHNPVIDLGAEGQEWNDLHIQNIHTDTMYTSHLVFFGRSMWAVDGAGLYFGADENIYPGNTLAGRTDGVTSLGNPSYRYRHIFLSGSVLGRSLTSEDRSLTVTVDDVVNSFEKIKSAAERATTVEDLRSSIVDSMGELIAQMKKKQDDRIEELLSEDYE